MKKKKRLTTGPRAYLAYAGIRVAGFLLSMFPIDLNLRTARWLGRMVWRLWPKARERTTGHLRLAMGAEVDEARVAALGLASVEHWSMYVVEFLCAFRLLSEWSWPRYVELGNLREVVQLLLQKRGALLLTGHYGNFELTAYLLAAVGFDMVAVMRPLDNDYLNAYVVRTRARRGLRLLSKAGASAEADGILRRGGAVGLVADQDAGRKGVFVEFFGQPASTYKSIALLAMQAEVPIVVGYARRLGECFRYVLHVQRIIHPSEWQDQPDPVRWITQEYSSAIEEFVREDPAQYLWAHRRWKTAPRAGRTPDLTGEVDAPTATL